jgi:hypothetical protein
VSVTPSTTVREGDGESPPDEDGAAVVEELPDLVEPSALGVDESEPLHAASVRAVAARRAVAATRVGGVRRFTRSLCPSGG